MLYLFIYLGYVKFYSFLKIVTGYWLVTHSAFWGGKENSDLIRRIGRPNFPNYMEIRGSP